MIRYLTIGAISAAGLAHLMITPAQFSDAIAHGVFFVILGTAQLIWAYAFWRSSAPQLYWTGIALSGGVVLLWTLTRVVSSPFEPNSHAIDLAMAVTISGELIGLFTLMLIGTSQSTTITKRLVLKVIGQSLVAALIFGFGSWGTGHVTEVVFPGLGHSDTHDSDSPTTEGGNSAVDTHEDEVTMDSGDGAMDTHESTTMDSGDGAMDTHESTTMN